MFGAGRRACRLREEQRPRRCTDVAETLDRMIALEGAVNFRDLGGYEAGDGMQTRWRTLFRADGLGELTEPDLVRAAPAGHPDGDRPALGLRARTGTVRRGSPPGGVPPLPLHRRAARRAGLRPPARPARHAVPRDRARRRPADPGRARGPRLARRAAGRLPLHRRQGPHRRALGDRAVAAGRGRADGGGRLRPERRRHAARCGPS